MLIFHYYSHPDNDATILILRYLSKNIVIFDFVRFQTIEIYSVLQYMVKSS